MNPPNGLSQYLLLAGVWAIWCCVHSALITPGVTAYITQHRPGLARYYRLLYNALAAATLLPVLWYNLYLQAEPFFLWKGPARLLQVGMLAAAVYLFWAGARNYDLLQFLGLRNLRSDAACTLISEDCRLEDRGVLGVVRHPWYAGGILILWARHLDGTAVVTNVVLSGYFVVGAWLEERKLLRQFGDAYRTYQHNVSMLFPARWLRVKLFGKRI